MRIAGLGNFVSFCMCVAHVKAALFVMYVRMRRHQLQSTGAGAIRQEAFDMMQGESGG